MWFQRNKVPKPHPEAEKAVLESKQVLRRVQARTEEVHEVAEASREFRRQNHFADSLQQIFGSTPGPPGRHTS